VEAGSEDGNKTDGSSEALIGSSTGMSFPIFVIPSFCHPEILVISNFLSFQNFCHSEQREEPAVCRQQR
jgi:hypothetical protein